jgi:hypothetical protein
MGSKVKAFMSGGRILTAEPTRFFGDAATAASMAEREAKAILAVSEDANMDGTAFEFAYGFDYYGHVSDGAYNALAESLAAFVGMSL